MTELRAAWCSIALVMMCAPFPFSLSAQAAPLTARLSASLPAPVKTTSVGSAFIRAAVWALAASTAARASRPYLCRLFGLPYFSEKYGAIASRTLGSVLVVAELSR